MTVSLLSFLGLCLLILLSLITVKRVKGSKWKLPPSPRKLPIIGNLHQLGGLPHRSLHSLSDKYGPVMLLRFGFTPVVVISSSEAAEEVLKTHDLKSCSRPKGVAVRKLSRGFRDIAFSPYSELWRELRKISVLDIFSLRKVRSFRRIREEESHLMVKKLSESASKQAPVDLNKTLFWLTSSIMFRVTFGQNFYESKYMDKDRVEELMFEAQAVFTFAFSDFFPSVLGRFLDWASGQRKRLNSLFVELDTFYQNVIDDHLKPGRRTTQDYQDIIDTMLDMIDKQGEDDYFKLTIDHIKGVIQNVFLAGVDTSAIIMIWAMAELMKNPGTMKKAQDEIRSCIGKKETIDEGDLDKVPCLKLVIKETLRLHPAAPLLVPREAMDHFKIQGYDIPPGTWLQINAWAIGRDPRHWESPDKFIPERFIDNPVDYKGQHFDLLPFGSGRRICPGVPMAIATIELGLLNLLYFFDWKLPDGMTEKDIDMEEAGTVTVVKKVPLELVPVRLG
ncbi:PREDICTED: cytochrome P450 71B20-like [Tarenaya hassleriana]|uniref:cytochrome P450 71B20-like n=1 Tax=Tarenaya hassleriana TaxID=28532 RepID=UPI00053C1298|nr:PREDICTED: cytochrome P450 71B20-like [Tarenaya hassleriana]